MNQQNCMKFFEIHYPYYALIKAENEEKAIEEYTKYIADDDGTLKDEIKEVDRDYALALFSIVKDKFDEHEPITKIIDEFRKAENDILLVDGTLS